jgi:divalent metal cation (Fe/Co/Zn/Cd) transporter
VDSDAWQHLSDAITSGFAFIGISIALLIRNPAADDWAALCASPVIIFNAYRKLRHPFAELLDAKPSPEIEWQIRSIASRVPGVVGVEKCQVRKVGSIFTSSFTARFQSSRDTASPTRSRTPFLKRHPVSRRLLSTWNRMKRISSQSLT